MRSTSFAVLCMIAACSGVAFARPIGSGFSAGAIRAAGFPDPLKQNTLNPVGFKSGNGGGSTGGGFGGFASAGIGLSDDPGSTTLALSGNAFHVRFDGYTAARAQTPIMLELTSNVEFQITNTSTANDAPISPVTFSPLTGSMTNDTPVSGRLTPGKYQITFAVAAGRMDSFEAQNTVGEWYSGFGSNKVENAFLDWKMKLTPAPTEYMIGIPPAESVFFPQGQSFTPSSFGTIPSDGRPGVSPGTVKLTHFTLHYKLEWSTPYDQLYLYDHFPAPSDAATGAGSFATGTHIADGVYVFPNVTLNYNTRYYAILPGPANLHDGPGDVYPGGVDMFYRDDLGGVIGEGYGDYDVGFNAAFEYVSTCPADLDGDGLVADSDFSLFVVAYDLLVCSDPAMPAGCPANLNSDIWVDDSDFSLFAVAYDELLCP